MPTLVKQIEFGGLNIKQNDLARDPRDARDCLNVITDSRGNLTRVNGFADTGFVPDTAISRVWKWYNFFKATDELIVRDSTGTNLKAFDMTTTTQIPFVGAGLSGPGQNGDIVLVNNVAYLDGMKYKYDGLMIHPLNLEPDTITVTGTGGVSHYYRSILASVDMQWNWTFGEYFQGLYSTSSTANVVQNVTNSEISGYSMTVNGLQNITAVGPTFTVVANNRQGTVDGKWVLFGFSSATQLKRYYVVSSTTTSITLSSDYYYNVDGTWLQGDATVTSQSFPNNTVFGTHVKILYTSLLSTAGFTLCDYFVVGLNATSTNAVNVAGVAIQPWIPITDIYEDFMDDEIIKLSLFQQIPNSLGATIYNGTAVVVDKDYCYFSTSYTLGGSIEQFGANDFFIPGTSEFGLIVGVFATEEFIVVYRERESYYISGNLVTGNFRVQPIGAVNVGLASQNGIVRFGNSGMFVANRGIYSVTNGGGFNEVSDKIEPFFNDDYYGLEPVLSVSQACVDTKRERVLFSIRGVTADKDRVLAFDFYRKAWFPFKLGDGSSSVSGLNLFQDKMMYSDAFKIYLEDSSLNTFDGGTIDGYYYSAWQDLGEPALQKKFLQVRAYSLDNTTLPTIKIKSYQNWDKTTVITDQDEEFTPFRYVTRRLNTNRCYSMSIGVEIADDNSNMILSGVEYDYELVQEVMKG
jgi:hypothetical protein